MKKLLLLTLFLIPLLSQSATISDYNPVSHWSCDETSGTRFDSNITNSNDLTDVNTVSYHVGVRGNACDLESSSSQYLYISDASQVGLDLTGNYTFCLWAQLEQTASAKGTPHTFINKITSADDGYRWVLSSTDNKENFYYWKNPNDTNIKSVAAETNTSNFIFHCATVNSTAKVVNFYENGSVDSTSTVSSSATDTGTNSEKFTIGAVNADTSATWFFDGMLDEISVFPSILTHDQILTLYASGSPLCYSTCTSTSTATSTTSSSTSLSAQADDAIQIGGLALLVIALTLITSLVAGVVIWIIRA